MREKYYLGDYCKTALPLAVWDELYTYTNNTRHFHDCVEIMFVYRGVGCCGIDNVKYPLLAGSMYVILEGHSHDYSCDPGMHFYNIMFAEKLFTTPEEKLLYDRFLKTVGAMKVITFKPSALKFVLDLIRRIEKELRRPDTLSEFCVKVLFMELMIYIIRGPSFYTQEIPVDKKQMLISRIYDYVAKHYKEKITLEKIAGISGHNPEYMGRLFKNMTGTDLSRYICRFRVEMTLGQLENSDKSISEIAFEHGFYDAAYYGKMFKRFFSITPARYRADIQSARTGKNGIISE